MNPLSITMPHLHTFAPAIFLPTPFLLPPSSCNYRISRKFLPTAALTNPDQTIVRRSAHYKPPVWTFERIQSLQSNYVGEAYTRHLDKLKEEVRARLEEEMVEDKDYFHKLELIDNLQRLGLSYHFEREIIKSCLEKVYNKFYGNNNDHGTTKIYHSLYAATLEFRILRQHGYYVPQEVFNGFRDEMGNFEDLIKEDVKGMLYLYEASFLSVEGESILDSAKDFTRKHLKEYTLNTENLDKDPYLSKLVSHALELPLHWRMLRMEARWFIEAYQQSPNVNSILLELAKLDYNMVQAIYQEDLKHASRWWKSTGHGEKLGFVRNRLVENFLWPIGEMYEPQYGYYRRMATQVNTLITTIDDVYDVYGTLDELKLFTDAVERWDINGIENLPDYMKLCFFGLHNSVNQIAADIFRDQGFNILPYSKKVWTDLCKGYLQEARWYYAGYTPTVEEYLEIAVTTIGAPIILHYAYVLVANPITKECLECFEQEYPDAIRCSAMLLRLADDLGTSPDEMKRGDVPKSIQCYMNENEVFEEEAREYIWNRIDETWKKMNIERFKTTPLPRTLIEASMNLGRQAQFMYLYGDGHSSQDQVAINNILALLVNPVS